MPDTIKGPTNVTKDNPDFFVGIKSLTEYSVQEGKLIHSRHETRLKRGKKTVFLQMVKQVF